MSEEIEEAAYKWNSHSAIENLKDAVRIAENHHVDAGMLNRMAIGILEQIYRKMCIRDMNNTMQMKYGAKSPNPWAKALMVKVAPASPELHSPVTSTTSAVTVSYTHLDVYKRQLYRNIGSIYR